MRRAGYTLTLPELIRTRDHGVTPDYIAGMGIAGYKELPIESLIRLRDHGVTPDYVVEARKRGHNNLSVDEIIRLRDRGEARTSDHFNNLWAHLRETHVGRVLEQAIRDLTH